MKWRQLQAFRETMVTGTASGAAEVLGISQPAISRLLEQLETALSMTLFDRTSGRLLPTAEARLFYEEVCKAFAGYDNLRIAADDIKFGRRGSLAISCLPALGLGFMPNVVAEFGRLHPDVHVRFDIQLSPRVESRVGSQTIDLGLAEFVAASFGIQRETFMKAPYVIALPAGHPLAQHQVLTPKELANEPMAALAPEAVCRRLLDAAFAAAKKPLNVVCESLYASGICGVVKEGLAVGMVDPVTAYVFRDSGIEVRRFEPQLMFNVELMYPEHRPHSRAASEFLKILRQKRNTVLNWVTEVVGV